MGENQIIRIKTVGINTEKDRKEPKRDRKGTEKDRQARNHILFTEKEGECS